MHACRSIALILAALPAFAANVDFGREVAFSGAFSRFDISITA